MAGMTTAPAERLTTRPLRESTAEEIRSLMARRRLNGVRLAVVIGRSQSYVSRRLTGETAFDVDDLERIATALGVGVRELLPRDGDDARGVTRQYLPGQRVVATIGTPRSAKRPTPARAARTHRPGRPVPQTRPIGRMSLARPTTPVPA